MGVVEVVVLRPDVLGHAGDDPEQESENLVEAAGREQAAVAAVVHQHECAQRQQRDGHDGGTDEPARYGRDVHGHPPRKREGHQRRRDLRQSPAVATDRIGVDERALVALDEFDGGHGQRRLLSNSNNREPSPA